MLAHELTQARNAERVPLLTKMNLVGRVSNHINQADLAAGLIVPMTLFLFQGPETADKLHLLADWLRLLRGLFW